jgi:hypothetical protein
MSFTVTFTGLPACIGLVIARGIRTSRHRVGGTNPALAHGGRVVGEGDDGETAVE